MRHCCNTVLHAWFVREGLHRVGLRHGKDCRILPMQIEELGKNAWRSQGRRVKTGALYA